MPILETRKELNIKDYQEALDNLKIMGDKDLYNERHLEWAKILQEAVDKANKYDEKETPKKVKIKNHGKLFHIYESRCPNCNEKVIWEDNRCLECGQKLDWSDEVCRIN